MKRPAIVNSLEILLLLLLLAGAILLLKPVSDSLNRTLAKGRDTLVSRIEDVTGLRVSYSSLSPSIFRSVRLNDLVLTDTASGLVVVSVSSVSVSYDFMALFRGDIPGMFREVVLENGFVGVDSEKNGVMLRKIQSLLAGNPAAKKNGAKGTAMANPLSVRIKNIEIRYTDRTQEISGQVGKGLVRIDPEKLSFQLDSNLRYTGDAVRAFGPFSSRVSFGGNINRRFDTGSASLVLSSLKGKNFSMSRLGLVTALRDGVLSVSSVQDLQPLDIRLVWDIAGKRVTGAFNCERLFPLKWIKPHNVPEVLDRLNDTVLSANAALSWSSDKGLEYSVGADIDVPYSFYDGGKIELKCSGTQDYVEIKKLTVNGEACEAAFSGSFNVKKMIPEGFLSVKRLVVPSGPSISGDVYLESAHDSFTLLAPLLSVNEATFSSVDFSAKRSAGTIDVGLSAYDSTGHISAEGSLIEDSGKFLQLYVAFDSISVANTASAILSFTMNDDPDLRSSIVKALNPYELTTEVYFSTDFSGVSFNCTRLVLASSEKDGLYVLLSLKGTQDGIDVTDINFSRSGYTVAGNVYAKFASDGVILDSALTVNSIPYKLSGIYNEKTLNLYGDYGLALSAAFDSSGGITGSVHTAGFPVPAGPLIFALSLDAGFVYPPAGQNQGNDWKITFGESTLEEVKGHLPLNSMVRFSGSMNSSGLLLDKISLVDQISRVSGSGGISVVPGSGDAPRFAAELNLLSRDSSESFKLKGHATLAADPVFDAELDVSRCPLMRFVPGQQGSDVASFLLTASGTPDNILASLDLRELSWRLGDFDLAARGKVKLENRVVSVQDAAGSWNGHTLSGVSGNLSLDTMRVELSTAYHNVIGESGISANLRASFTPDSKKTYKNFSDLADLFSQYTIRATIADLDWKTVKVTDPIECSFVHEPGVTALYAGKNDALTGYLLNDGTFSLQTNNELPIRLHADGAIKNSRLDVRVSDFYGDLAAIWPFTGYSIVKFDKGSLGGDFTITGLLNDPEFSGTLHANDIQIEAPGNVAGVYTASPFTIQAEGKKLTADPFRLTGKEGGLTVSARADFDQWLPVNVVVDAKTLPGERMKLDTSNYFFKARGYITCNIELEATLRGLSLSGDCMFEQGYFAVLFSSFYKQFTSSGQPSFWDNYDIKLNLNLDIGKKVEFRWPNDDLPVIRGLVQVDKPFVIALDSSNDTYQFKGTANLKGGEIFYIKRSFYLRQGSIVFDENENVFNPFVTLKAEIRERDENGDPVRIILSVDKQPLMNFTPVLTADPPKSDAELMSLLGQAASADTTGSSILRNTVVSATDIFTQMGLFRNAENSVRDLLNVDIFSIRTLLLQNAVFGPAMQGSSTDKAMTIGNYFDNTTVYTGKYLGSAIYADALLHFSYYDPVTASDTRSSSLVYGNLLFQPELGFEVTTPLFLMRWGITPSHPQTLFIADNSITLSWKFSY